MIQIPPWLEVLTVSFVVLVLVYVADWLRGHEGEEKESPEEDT